MEPFQKHLTPSSFSLINQPFGSISSSYLLASIKFIDPEQFSFSILSKILSILYSTFGNLRNDSFLDVDYYYSLIFCSLFLQDISASIYISLKLLFLRIILSSKPNDNDEVYFFKTISSFYSNPNDADDNYFFNVFFILEFLYYKIYVIIFIIFLVKLISLNIRRSLLFFYFWFDINI